MIALFWTKHVGFPLIKPRNLQLSIRRGQSNLTLSLFLFKRKRLPPVVSTRSIYSSSVLTAFKTVGTVTLRKATNAETPVRKNAENLWKHRKYRKKPAWWSFLKKSKYLLCQMSHFYNYVDDDRYSPACIYCTITEYRELFHARWVFSKMQTLAAAQGLAEKHEVLNFREA